MHERSLDYESRPLSIGSIAANLLYAYSDDFWTTPGGLRVATLLPTYQRPTSDSSQLQARLAWQGIEVSGMEVDVALWGKNLADESYYNFGVNIFSSFGFDINTYGEPRTYGLELEIDF